VVSRLLIEGCDVVVTMDDEGTEVSGGSLLVEDGTIAWVGRGAPPADQGEVERIDGTGCVAIPGLVNTHHHLYQSMTRAFAQQDGLFGWLVSLYPVWAGLDAEWERAGSRVALAELALSGCATTADHHYVFPAGSDDLLEAEIGAAREIGLRFHPCRGSMDLGTSDGGLPPDHLVENTDDALARTEAAIRSHHDPAPGSMLRIAVAPCSPFSVSERLMRESAQLARRLGVRLHTHLAETLDEERHCVERFGRRPVELMQEWGWLGEDVWYAHCVHMDHKDVRRLAETGSGVAWCPSSNLRLGSGIAPGRSFLEERVPVGLGVDGSASNDAGSLLAEARQAMLVSRANGVEGGLTAREALRVVTRGGAEVLGRDDVGVLAPGMRADIALFPVDGLETAGSDADPVAALVFSPPARVRHLLVEGRAVVRDGRLVGADEEEIAREGHRVSTRIAQGVGR
jgi:cytosine/adenosine deaminase-related metal-dependent hydrolase